MSGGTMVCGNMTASITGVGVFYYCTIDEWNCESSNSPCYVPYTTIMPITPQPSTAAGPQQVTTQSPTIPTISMGPAPASNKTDSPSLSPTVEPTTNIPTTDKPTTYKPTTLDPTTFEPTSNNPTTSNPTTFNPTTSNPSTFNPSTFSPSTSNPATSNPTTSWTNTDQMTSSQGPVLRTKAPSKNPTNSPLSSSATSPSSTSASDFQFYIYIVISAFTLLILVSLIYSKYISRNDFYRIGALLAVAIHFNDTLSDIFFCINISFHPKYPLDGLPIMLTLAIGFVVVPSIITLFQLYFTIKKWKRTDELCQWLSNNVKILYFICVIMGSSFVGVELCTSNLFNMKLFDMPLSRSQLMQFQTKSIYSTVLLEVNNNLLFTKLPHFVSFNHSNVFWYTIECASASVTSMVFNISSKRDQWNCLCINVIFIIIDYNIHRIHGIAKKYCKITRFCNC